MPQGPDTQFRPPFPFEGACPAPSVRPNRGQVSACQRLNAAPRPRTLERGVRFFLLCPEPENRRHGGRRNLWTLKQTRSISGWTRATRCASTNTCRGTAISHVSSVAILGPAGAPASPAARAGWPLRTGSRRISASRGGRLRRSRTPTPCDPAPMSQCVPGTGTHEPLRHIGAGTKRGAWDMG